MDAFLEYFRLFFTFLSFRQSILANIGILSRWYDTKTSPSMEHFGLAIVGAGKIHPNAAASFLTRIVGIHGLVMLKTYRDVHPEASIVVLEKERSLGGVWAMDRLYPGLHTNNHFRTYVPRFGETFALADNMQFRSLYPFNPLKIKLTCTSSVGTQ